MYVDLLSNSIKKHASGKKITVKICRKARNHADLVCIRFPQTRARGYHMINWARFSNVRQIDNSLSRKAEGSGVGLAALSN